MRLDAVIGHDRLRAILSRALERDRLPPALLLSGPDGVGKKTLALAVAQAALCERAPVPEPCGECATCRKVARRHRPRSGSRQLRDEADRHPGEDHWRNFRLHPDLVLVEGWRLTRTGRPRPEPEIRVGQVRDLVAEVPGTPFEARRRVFIVDDAHGMNEIVAERPAEEPGGAASALAPDPGERPAPAAATDDPLPLPDPALRPPGPRRGGRRPRRAPGRCPRTRPACAPAWPPGAWGRPWPSNPRATRRSGRPSSRCSRASARWTPWRGWSRPRPSSRPTTPCSS